MLRLSPPLDLSQTQYNLSACWLLTNNKYNTITFQFVFLCQTYLFDNSSSSITWQSPIPIGQSSTISHKVKTTQRNLKLKYL